MRTVCEFGKCTGCMACVGKCKFNAISVQDNITEYCAIIDETKCVNCGSCTRVCQKNNPVELKKPLYWKQGWAIEDEVRDNSSSGGAATAIALEFIKKGGIVCSCIFKDGEFKFAFAEKKEEIAQFCGSKYVKSNPIGIYEKIYKNLKCGRNVLFIGLPCQIAAAKRYIGTEFCGSLYTIDLICHGTPSPQILKSFLGEYNVNLEEIGTISFREKSRYSVKTQDRSVQGNGITDFYMIAFLGGLIYTENCYECDYATIERVSDITLGDSWGSDLPDTEAKKGISLILCQTEKGKKLVEDADLLLYDVNLQKAIDANCQLSAPSEKSYKRDKFFDGFFNSEKFGKLVFRAFPKWCIRQQIKKIINKCQAVRGTHIGQTRG